VSSNDPTPYLPAGFPIDAVATSDDWRRDQAMVNHDEWNSMPTETPDQMAQREHEATAPHLGCDCTACCDARYAQTPLRRPITTLIITGCDGATALTLQSYVGRDSGYEARYEIRGEVEDGLLDLSLDQARELHHALGYLLGPPD
jgi:hypothetical protein